MKNIMRLSFVLVLLLSSCSKPQIISKVTIRDADFKVIAVLETDQQIKAFDSLWKSKVKLTSPIKAKWAYKIDIQHPDRSGGRWLYTEDGYTQLLDIFEQPIYRVPSIDEFNRLVGIHSLN